jgi:hypothetical protein
MPTLEDLTRERDELLALLDNPPDGTDLDEVVTRATDLGSRIEAWNATQERVNAERRRLADAVPAPRQQPTVTPVERPTGPQRQEPTVPQQRLGEIVTRSSAFRDFQAGGGRGRAVIDLPGETRALFATTNNVLQNPRYPGTQLLVDTPLTILDLIDRQSMGSNSIEWVQETAAPAAAVEVTEGSAKPESSWTLALKTDTAATIAHWVNITRQALDDDAQMRGYIDGRLIYGLNKRLNGQILGGNGTAPNLRGILNQSGIGTYTAGTAGEAAIISIRKAKTVAQLSEFSPDAVVLNPVDWEAVELSQDTTNQFRVSPNVQQALTPTLWGLNVIVTTNITGTAFGTTGGTFLVGGFREGATLWERTGAQIFITDSHASNFTSNILTLLAELRAALTVWRPAAFVKGTLGASRT